LNPTITDQIECSAQSSGVSLAGRIRYDRAVTDAQIEGITVVEYGGQAAEDIQRTWQNLNARIAGCNQSAPESKDLRPIGR
jgi:MinD superfamily P-loop ATPase